MITFFSLFLNRFPFFYYYAQFYYSSVFFLLFCSFSNLLNHKYPDIIVSSSNATVDGAAEEVLQIFLQEMQNGALDFPQAQTVYVDILTPTMDILLI
jgi:hypothetical protein